MNDHKLNSVYADIRKEMAAQVARGYTAEHDDEHINCELLRAADALDRGDVGRWPWEVPMFVKIMDKPERERQVIIAALMGAEVGRITRLYHKRAQLIAARDEQAPA